MRPEVALSLADDVMARLYTEWSEGAYCSGWITDGEAEFVEHLLALGETDHHELAEYEVESIKKIRALLHDAAEAAR
jgi:hypothetical protein